MLFMCVVAGVALFMSFLADRQKTCRSLKIAWKKFSSLLPALGAMLLLASLVLGFLPERELLRLLAGHGRLWGLIVASLAGSVSAVPGFIAFPLAAVLLDKGVPYMILAAFTTTLMMVGVVTFPLERAYLGTPVALLRNVLGLAVALAVSLSIGVIFGEILP